MLISKILYLTSRLKNVKFVPQVSKTTFFHKLPNNTLNKTNNVGFARVGCQNYRVMAQRTKQKT